MGVSSYLTSGESSDLSPVVGFLPVFGVSLIAVTYHIGLGPIPWSYTGDDRS